MAASHSVPHSAACPIPVTLGQISVQPQTGTESVSVRIALPEEICERIRAWVRDSQYERIGRYIPFNMFVEEEFDTASFFYLDETPCVAGQWHLGSYEQGPLFTGIEVTVPGEGPELDWTVPHDQFGLDGLLTAVRLIRRLLEIGATYDDKKVD